MAHRIDRRTEPRYSRGSIHHLRNGAGFVPASLFRGNISLRLTKRGDLWKKCLTESLAPPKNESVQTETDHEAAPIFCSSPPG